MLLIFLVTLTMSSAQAESVRPSVTQVSDARAVHLLFGEDGETVSNCVPTTDGWSCAAVDVESPTDVHLLVDTKLYALGPVEVEGPDLTVERTNEGPVLRWSRGVEPVDGRGDAVVVVRVNDPQSERAPMLRLDAGTLTNQVGCADDGRFPDGIPNDGMFYCATVLRTSGLDEEEWSLSVSMRTQDGEVEELGAFSYSEPGGLRYVSVTVGDPSASSGEDFPIVGPSAQAPEVEQEPVAEAPPAPEQPKPPPGPEDHSSGFFSSVSSGAAWLFVLVAVVLGWFLGSRVGRSRSDFDEATPLPVQPMDERGPVPDRGGILVSSASPSDTLIHVVHSLTVLRRVVIVGEIEDSALAQAHSILRVTDPDRFAIQKLIHTLMSDGGLPPVLLILGVDSVLDTGGASPTPTQDLLAAVQGDIWCAVFLPEEEELLAGFEGWGHDPQAGWSKL